MYLYWIDSESVLRYGGHYTSIRELRKKAGDIFRNYEDSKHIPAVLFQDDDGILRQMEKDETT